jgi:Putative auto-transporter adhesin, head GIN domain
MNKKQLFVLLFAALSLFSCFRGRAIRGSGNVTTEKRQTASFTGVNSESIVSVEVRNGPTAEVVVEADDNLQPYIYTEVKGDELVIGVRRFHSFENCTFKVYVTAPRLQNISTSGAGSVTSNGVLKDDKSISISSSGVGSITAEVDAPAVDADVSGVGTIKLSGRSKNYTASVSGAGSIESFDMLSENADADVSGVGHINLHASVKLDASVSGAGDIRYRGAAAVQTSVSGVGKVTKE